MELPPGPLTDLDARFAGDPLWEEYKGLGGPTFDEQQYRSLVLKTIKVTEQLREVFSDGRCDDNLALTMSRFGTWANAGGYRSQDLKKEPYFFQRAVDDIETNIGYTSVSIILLAAEYTSGGIVGLGWLVGVCEEGDNGMGDVWAHMEYIRSKTLLLHMEIIRDRILEIRRLRPEFVP